MGKCCEDREAKLTSAKDEYGGHCRGDGRDQQSGVAGSLRVSSEWEFLRYVGREWRYY